jgi:hypothetical protein
LASAGIAQDVRHHGSLRAVIIEVEHALSRNGVGYGGGLVHADQFALSRLISNAIEH